MAKKPPVNVVIAYDMIDKSTHDGIIESAGKLLRLLDPADNKQPTELYRQTIWPDLEGHDLTRITPQIVLTPLYRLGVPQGMSGSEVFVGHYTDLTKQCLKSPPMIVKFSSIEGKLKEEKTNAKSIKHYITENAHCFAFPLYLDEDGRNHRYSVMWSPFTASSSTFRPSGFELIDLGKIQDLYGLLKTSIDIDEIHRLLVSTFDLLKQLHMNPCVKQKRSLFQEYSSYLRNIDDPNDWSGRWRYIWGMRDEVDDLGARWANPFKILERIRSIPEVELYCGAIHGDLHPRNIIISSDKQPRIIDFGWSKDNMHVAKDYALLECNLRFVALPSEISFNALRKLSKWIAWDSASIGTGDSLCDQWCTHISILRDKAKIALTNGGRITYNDKEWINQYIIPLFLVSFGLLKFISSFDNQISARFTVLSLARYLSDHI